MIVAPCGKLGHQHAVRIGGGAELRLERGDAPRDAAPAARRAPRPRPAACDRPASRRRRRSRTRCRRARTISRERRRERRRDRRPRSAPSEREPARGERRDHVREVPVLALARQDLVADDQRADAGSGHGCGSAGRRDVGRRIAPIGRRAGPDLARQPAPAASSRRTTPSRCRTRGRSAARPRPAARGRCGSARRALRRSSTAPSGPAGW